MDQGKIDKAQNTVNLLQAKDDQLEVKSDIVANKFSPVKKSQVVAVMRKEYQKCIEDLPNEEKHAIEKYTYNSVDTKENAFFKRLNAMNRGDIPGDKKLRRYSNLISNALKRKPLKHDIVCYRTMDGNHFKNLKVGDTFDGKQFFSTSVISTKTMKGKFMMEIHARKGTNGLYIEGLSRFKKQREFLIDKDCEYTILGIEDNKIILEVKNAKKESH